MKSFILFFLAVIFSSTACFSQKQTEVKVPESVSNAFKTQFPLATVVKWEMENSSEYEVNFKIKSHECSAAYNKDGKWLETETIVYESSLPVAITQAVVKAFPGFKIKEAVSVETPDKAKLYELVVVTSKKAYEVQYSETGVMLKKNSAKEKKN